jgi:S1-C subfamily serine protease
MKKINIVFPCFVLVIFFQFSLFVSAYGQRNREYSDGQKRKDTEKYITTDEILFDLEEGDITEEYYKNDGNRKKNKVSKSSSNEDAIKEASSGIDGFLTSLLLELNYLDTSDRFFPDYKNSLQLNMTVDEIHYTYIRPSTKRPPIKVYLDMVANFKLKSYYGKEIVSRTNSKEIVLSSWDASNTEEELRRLIKDLFDEFLFSEEVQSKTESFEHFDKQDESAFTVLEVQGSKGTIDVEKWRTSVATIISEDGHGSACVISEDGYLVSNYHVVGQSETVRVKFFDNSYSEGKVLRKQPDSDLALIKVEKSGLSFLSPADTIGELGEVVFLIGTPADTLMAGSVFKGVLSGIRDFEGAKFLQTDAKVNPGNSGGAMINQRGELVGIVSSKYVGYGIEGIGFAIPVSEIKERLKISAIKPAVKIAPPTPPIPKKGKK